MDMEEQPSGAVTRLPCEKSKQVGKPYESAQRTSHTTQKIAFLVMSKINADLLKRKLYTEEIIACLSNVCSLP